MPQDTRILAPPNRIIPRMSAKRGFGEVAATSEIINKQHKQHMQHSGEGDAGDVSGALPALPSSTLTGFGAALLNDEDIAQIQDELTEIDEKKDVVFRLTRDVFKHCAKLLFAIRTGQMSGAEQLLADASDKVSGALEQAGVNVQLREGRLSTAIEELTKTKLLFKFFETGKLAGPEAVQPCSDEEYLSGSLGFAQEISRYCVNRASSFDIASIQLCRELLTCLNGQMLEFDLRNGPLRRKYDGLKYALKRVEDIWYELSLVREEDAVIADNVAKRAKADGDENAAQDASSTLLDLAAFAAIRQRMEDYDKQRENVIKQSRDIQKLSKQAIFSVQRGQVAAAEAKLAQARALAETLGQVIDEHRTLRAGAYSNSLEEYAEGLLLAHWVKEKRVLRKADIGIVNTHEFIGALSDLTGEIGRVAVAKASMRDMDTVVQAHETDVVVASAIMQIDVGGRFHKKAEAVNMNLRKVEDIVYELTLAKMGRKRPTATTEEEPPNTRGNANADDDL